MNFVINRWCLVLHFAWQSWLREFGVPFCHVLITWPMWLNHHHCHLICWIIAVICEDLLKHKNAHFTLASSILMMEWDLTPFLTLPHLSIKPDSLFCNLTAYQPFQGSGHLNAASLTYNAHSLLYLQQPICTLPPHLFLEIVLASQTCPGFPPLSLVLDPPCSHKVLLLASDYVSIYPIRLRTLAEKDVCLVHVCYTE